MQTYLKTKPIGVQLLLFVGLAIGLWVIISLMAMSFGAQAAGINLAELSNMNKWDSSNLANKLIIIRSGLIAQFLGMFVLPSLLFAYFSDPQPRQHLGLRQPAHEAYWLVGSLLLLMALPLVEYTGMLNQQLDLGPALNEWMHQREAEVSNVLKLAFVEKTTTNLVANLVFIALFAGIGEELFFRGIIQRMMIQGTRSPWAGIIITAFLFSFFHFQFLGFAPRLILGVLLGLLYWYSGSIWVAILAHFLYDATLVTILHYNPHLLNQTSGFLPQATLPWLALGSVALLAAIVWWMKRNSATYTPDEPVTVAPPPNSTNDFIA
ncbi:CPBP family intramembrane glutamic endopeptidase [Pseudocnuella soli]|uniref:CPBP family intramembrane glutamic endopeptidase n=1 Tax=Pseudocnuella soli TaxID=2502779 RepID=UPI001051D426|nr:CPBP family intramembrane glutamic endopeptidase [Pseudocnuella soli]